MLADSREQTITEILMDTQTEIKELIKKSVANISYMISFEQRVAELIDKNLSEIPDKGNEMIKQRARDTLLKFAREEYQTTARLLNLGNLAIILVIGAYNNIGEQEKRVLQNELNETLQGLGKGDYNKAFSQLGNSQAKVSYGQSLYGYSELTERHKEQVEMVANLREKTNLVICDTHSDCSERCRRWQGGIYSLDGSSGTTEDGRRFIPLETATKVIDKYGHINGLLGYNCRHKLHEFRTGMKAITVSEKERKREYAVTTQQRALEREIRNIKDNAVAFKGVDNDKYVYYRDKARTLTAEYKKFCQDNNRVEYRSRLKI